MIADPILDPPGPLGLGKILTARTDAVLVGLFFSTDRAFG